MQDWMLKAMEKLVADMKADQERYLAQFEKEREDEGSHVAYARRVGRLEAGMLAALSNINSIVMVEKMSRERDAA